MSQSAPSFVEQWSLSNEGMSWPATVSLLDQFCYCCCQVPYLSLAWQRWGDWPPAAESWTSRADKRTRDKWHTWLWWVKPGWPSHVFLIWCTMCARVLFADYWGGWACFTVSILVIGMITGLIGDLASSFGCTIGMKDAVTAISFVALGTSLPGG